MRLRNSISLIGRLGKDPEHRILQSGAEVCKFSLATSERYTNKQGEQVEETQWHTCVAWRKLAAIIAQHAKKGMEVAVRGKMTYRNWEDNDGNKRFSAEVVAEDFLILSPRSEQSKPAQHTAAPAAKPTEAVKEKQDDNDIPF